MFDIRRMWPSNLRGILLITGLAINYELFSQDEKATHGSSEVKIMVSVGLNFQNYIWEKPYHGIWRDVFLTWAYRTSRGPGLSTALSFRLNSNFGIIYSPTWRYDVVTPASEYKPLYEREGDKYGFISDHHFTVCRYFDFKRLRCFKKKIGIGAGYSVISLGQSWNYKWHLTYINPPKYLTGDKVPLQFNGPHLYLLTPVYKKLSLDIRLLYVAEGKLVYSAYSRTYFLSVSASYNFGSSRSDRF